MYPLPSRRDPIPLLWYLVPDASLFVDKGGTERATKSSKRFLRRPFWGDTFRGENASSSWEAVHVPMAPILKPLDCRTGMQAISYNEYVSVVGVKRGVP